MLIDLHTHTSASDGHLTGVQMVEYLVEERHISAISITDHNSIDAVEGASKVAEELGVYFIPGFESSTTCQSLGIDPHILGYFPDVRRIISNSWFQEVFHGVTIKGSVRVKQICENSQANPIIIDGKSVSVTVDEVMQKPQHEFTSIVVQMFLVIKKKIFKLTGYCFDVNDISNLIWGREDVYKKHRQFFLDHKVNTKSGKGLWFRPKTSSIYPDCLDIIRHIVQYEGIAVLAHPSKLGSAGSYERVSISEEILQKLVSYGLGGMEIYFHGCRFAEQEAFHKMARRFGLIVTGGTDYHGPRIDKDKIPGHYNGLPIPEKCFWDLWKAVWH